MQADKSHLHHKLLALGYTHRQTVLLIYSISILFSLSSIILYVSPPLGVVLMFILIIFSIELIVEFTGLIDNNYRPILNLISRKSSQRRLDFKTVSNKIKMMSVLLCCYKGRHTHKTLAWNVLSNCKVTIRN